MGGEQSMINSSWVGNGALGGGMSSPTYFYYSKHDRPEITIYDEFKDLQTIDDVKEFLKNSTTNPIRSFTSCYFNFDSENSFYTDQQGCVTWCYEQSIGVYTLGEKSNVVSETIPEFLSRIKLESKILFEYYTEEKRDFTEEEQNYINVYEALYEKASETPQSSENDKQDDSTITDDSVIPIIQQDD